LHYERGFSTPRYRENPATNNHQKATGKPVAAIAINAGVGVGGAFIETDLQTELNVIELNITSSVHLAKRFVPDIFRM
jgi:uncharacterized protein